MAGPDYGALGATLKSVRILQSFSLIAIIGMTANFISMIVSDSQTPPSVLIGTLSVVSVLQFDYMSLTNLLYKGLHSSHILRDHFHPLP